MYLMKMKSWNQYFVKLKSWNIGTNICLIKLLEPMFDDIEIWEPIFDETEIF